MVSPVLETGIHHKLVSFSLTEKNMESSDTMHINYLKINILLSLRLNQLSLDFHDYPLLPKEILKNKLNNCLKENLPLVRFEPTFPRIPVRYEINTFVLLVLKTQDNTFLSHYISLMLFRKQS